MAPEDIDFDLRFYEWRAKYKSTLHLLTYLHVLNVLCVICSWA